jgi:ABC-type sugar transport system substrate-binding protein
LQYSKSLISGYQSEASKLGISVKVFDPGFDPTVQANIVRNIIQSGKYNALAIQPLSEQLCNPSTKDAPNANIVVVIDDLPICDRALAPWDESKMYVPGTLAMVGGQTNVTYLKASMTAALSELQGPQVVALLVGQATTPHALAQKQLLDDYAKQHSDFKVVGVLATDFTTAGGTKATETILQAHPDLTAILSPASTDLTVGAAAAIKRSGRTKVKIIDDLGSASQIMPLIKSGIVLSSFAYYPASVGSQTIKAIADAFAGKTVDRLIPALNLGSPTAPYEVNLKNVDTFEPQF